MITIPQCLEFPCDVHVKGICDFYLKMLQLKNEKTYLHSKQVANYATSIAAKIGLSPRDVSTIQTAALLHDIGHLATPSIILYKAPFLTKREEAIYKRHCLAGASMLENIPEFTNIVSIIRAHHEKWDGTGFPKRLKGQNIPIGARIIAIADYYDSTINPCTLHWQKTHAEAIVELQNKAGLDFESALVRAFIESVLPVAIETHQPIKNSD